jgi:hypothetical protein
LSVFLIVVKRRGTVFVFSGEEGEEGFRKGRP